MNSKYLWVIFFIFFAFTVFCCTPSVYRTKPDGASRIQMSPGECMMVLPTSVRFEDQRTEQLLSMSPEVANRYKRRLNTAIHANVRRSRWPQCSSVNTPLTVEQQQWIQQLERSAAQITTGYVPQSAAPVISKLAESLPHRFFLFSHCTVKIGPGASSNFQTGQKTSAAGTTVLSGAILYTGSKQFRWQNVVIQRQVANAEESQFSQLANLLFGG